MPPKQAVAGGGPAGAGAVGWSAADVLRADPGFIGLATRRRQGREVVLQTPAAAAKRLRGAYTWEMVPCG